MINQKSLNDADLIDIIRRLRQHINQLDNVHILTLKIKTLKDSAFTTMAERLAIDVDNVAASAANMLKMVESMEQYQAIVLRYKSPKQEEAA